MTLRLKACGKDVSSGGFWFAVLQPPMEHNHNSPVCLNLKNGSESFSGLWEVRYRISSPSCVVEVRSSDNGIWTGGISLNSPQRGWADPGKREGSHSSSSSWGALPSWISSKRLLQFESALLELPELFPKPRGFFGKNFKKFLGWEVKGLQGSQDQVQLLEVNLFSPKRDVIFPITNQSDSPAYF